jgi:hypothetical protein
MPLDVALALAGLLRGGAVLMRRGALAVKDFIFKVNLVAVVRVRAADENIARQVVPNVSERQAPLKLDWLTQNNAATGHDARVTDVNFSVGTIKPFRKSG